MHKKILLLLVFALVVLVGLMLMGIVLQLLLIRILILLNVITIAILFLLYVYFRANTSNYEDKAQKLFQETQQDLIDIMTASIDVNDSKVRQQLDLICDDTLVLLKKVAEKTPQSRISTVKFIRGNLDFILYDILPQYIEMQDTPRYYEHPDEKMAQAQEAIEIYANFLHNRIVALEIVDDIRYEVAIEMLKALNIYSNTTQQERIAS